MLIIAVEEWVNNQEVMTSQFAAKVGVSVDLFKSGCSIFSMSICNTSVLTGVWQRSGVGCFFLG